MIVPNERRGDVPHPPVPAGCAGNVETGSGQCFSPKSQISYKFRFICTGNLSACDSVQSPIVYTDGIPEACNPDGSFFSDVQFKELFSTCIGMTAMEACEHIIVSVSAFQVKNPADDITILVLKRNQVTGENSCN